jgi:hypothetical protein
VLKELLRFGVVLADAARLGHPRRGTLLAFEDIKGGLRYTVGHGLSLVKNLIKSKLLLFDVILSNLS